MNLTDKLISKKKENCRVEGQTKNIDLEISASYPMQTQLKRVEFFEGKNLKEEELNLMN